MPCYRYSRLHVLSLILLSLALPGSTRGNFLLTKITDNAPGSQFSSFNDPVINNHEQIAFAGSDGIHSGGSYYRYDMATQQFGFIFNIPSALTPQMGDNGEVVWQTNGGGSNTPIRKGSPGNVTLIAQPPVTINGVTIFAFNAFPTINANGAVAFVGTPSANRFVGFYKEQNGTTSTVFDTDNGPGASDGSFFQFSPDVNDNDQVAYMGSADVGGQGLWLWSKTGNTTDLLDSAPASTFSYGPSINEAGKVAYTRSNNSIYVTQKGSSPQLYVTAADVGKSILGAAVTINNHDQIAFEANDGAGGITLYVKNDPTSPAVRVAGAGDSFDGSTIQSIIFDRGAFNDAGEVVFSAFMKNGREEMIFATVPEPGCIAICLVGIVALRRNRRRIVT
jgi:hypothetical protein